jgi:hypothetical protein
MARRLTSLSIMSVNFSLSKFSPISVGVRPDVISSCILFVSLFILLSLSILFLRLSRTTDILARSDAGRLVDLLVTWVIFALMVVARYRSGCFTNNYDFSIWFSTVIVGPLIIECCKFNGATVILFWELTNRKLLSLR